MARFLKFSNCVYEITNESNDRFSRIHRALIPGIFTSEFLSRKMISLDLQNFIDLLFLQNYIFLIFKVYIATNFPLGND